MKNNFGTSMNQTNDPALKKIDVPNVHHATLEYLNSRRAFKRENIRNSGGMASSMVV